MESWTNLAALLEERDTLRGLDHLIERVRRVLERYRHLPLRLPARKPDEKPLARTA